MLSDVKDMSTINVMDYDVRNSLQLINPNTIRVNKLIIKPSCNPFGE